jgi:chromosome segregation ATPase
LKVELEEKGGRLETEKEEIDRLIGELKANLENANARSDKESQQLENEQLALQTVNTRLEEEKLALQTANTRLEEEKLALQTANSRFEEEKLALQTTNTRLEEEKLALQTANSRLEEERFPLQTTNTRFEEEKLALQTTTSRFEEEKLALQTTNTRLEEEKLALQTTNSRLEKERLALQAANTRLERETLDVQTTNTQLESENIALQATNTQLEEEKTASQATNAQLEGEKLALQATNTRLEEEKTALQATNTQLEGEKFALQATNTRLEQGKTALQATNTQLEGETSKLQDAIATNAQLNSQIHELEIANAQFSTIKDLLQREKSELQSVNARLSNDKTELEQMNLVLQEANDHLKQQKLESITVNGSIRLDVSDFGSQTPVIENETTALQTTIAHFEEEIADLRRDNAQLHSEMGKLSQNNTQLLSELKASDVKASDLALAKQSLEARLAIFQRQAAEWESDRQSLSCELDSLRSELSLPRFCGSFPCEALELSSAHIGECFDALPDGEQRKSESQSREPELLAEIKRLTELTDSEASKVSKLLQQNSDLQQEIQAIKAFSDHRLKLLLRERAEIETHMQNENDSLQQELDRTREQQAEGLDREFELQRKVELLRQKVASLNSKHETETEFLRARIEALDSSSLPISPQLADLRERQAELERALEAAHRQLSEKVSELRSFESRAKNGMEGHDSKIEQLSLENSDLRTFNQSLAEQYEELRREDIREISELRQTVEKLKGRITRLKLNGAESNRKCTQCEALKATLMDAQSEIKNCQHQVAQLTIHNQTLIDQIADLNASLDRGHASYEDSAPPAADDEPATADFVDEVGSGRQRPSVADEMDARSLSAVSQKQLVRLIGMLWLQSLERDTVTS